MKPLHQQIKDIEKNAGNELNYLLEVGADYFPTAELLEMCGMIKARIRLFDKLHKIVILLGASSPAWLLIGFLCAIVGLNGLALYVTMLFPISFFLCIAGAIWMKREFNSKGHLEHIARVLRWELIQRQKAKEQRWN
ncbi:MAG: hypothetical protein AAF990_09040 [Bacteroidota bacterium]